MGLTLEVVGVHAASMGANVRRVLGDAELKIGRDSENDWILPQSYVSRRQAIVRCVNGMYFLEQVGSCPIVLNEAARPLERNKIARLAAGDRILIDDIEVRVFDSEAMPAMAPPGAEHTGYPRRGRRPLISSSRPVPRSIRWNCSAVPARRTRGTRRRPHRAYRT